jgi:hypothetical protein
VSHWCPASQPPLNVFQRPSGRANRGIRGIHPQARLGWVGARAGLLLRESSSALRWTSARETQQAARREGESWSLCHRHQVTGWLQGSGPETPISMPPGSFWCSMDLAAHPGTKVLPAPVPGTEAWGPYCRGSCKPKPDCKWPALPGVQIKSFARQALC